ncbi:T9SS type A sorting domain-containing protein [Adhaeribacter aquaticus]|uniref:T9SS type A sorting domain-containing protein n=1 Tax=Adhaeribacter aquaticus TaxID=299567 RepID=UPI0004216303|nr:T9SS type A sorting domain-containing protein [Adhaeribacter aquaticus]
MKLLFTPSLRLFLLSVLLTLTFWPNSAAYGHNHYSTGGTSGVVERNPSSNKILTRILNAEYAADDNPTTYATLHRLLALDVLGNNLIGEQISLRIKLDGTSQAGTRAGFLVAPDDYQIAAADIWSNVYITTYLNNSFQEEHKVSSNLLKAAFLSNKSKPFQLEFISTKDFNQVKIELRAGASLEQKLRVYYGYGIPIGSQAPVVGYLSRFDGTGSSLANKYVAASSCSSTGWVTPENVADRDLTNFATINNLAALTCSLDMKVSLEKNAPANYVAGFIVGSSGILDADALSRLTITTFLNGAEQESTNEANLLSLALLPDGKQQLYFTSTKPFNEVRLRLNSLATLLQNLRIYYGFGLEPTYLDPRDKALSQFSSLDPQYYATKENGILCPGCTTLNAFKAADNDLTNFAELKDWASLLSSKGLKLRINKTGTAGNRAGVILRTVSGLIDVAALENIVISTYSGDRLIESARGSSLVALNLLNNNKQEVYFYTTQPFDYVAVELNRGATVLEDTEVYYAFADDKLITPEGTVPNDVLPVTLLSFNGKLNGNSVKLSWSTASEENNNFFEIERSLSPDKGFAPVGKVAGKGNTNTVQEYSFVDPLPAANKEVVYYRLRQEDFNGDQEYSKVVAVKLPLSNNLASLKVYPNPTASGQHVTVQLHTAGVTTGDYTISVFDLQGKLVRNLKISEPTTPLSLNALSTGVYFVQVSSPQNQFNETQRLVVNP